MARSVMAARSLCITGAVLIGTVAGPVLAQAPKAPPQPSWEKGLALSDRLCTNCHLVEDSPGATVPVGVPTFRSIANKPGQTGERIKDVLIKPHSPMPAIQLSNNEILDIVAYLETLRTDKSKPPLLAPGGIKPKYPSPS